MGYKGVQYSVLGLLGTGDRTVTYGNDGAEGGTMVGGGKGG